VLEGKKGGDGVGFKKGLEVRGRRVVDGGRTQKAASRGRTHPDVETAKGGEDLIDEHEGLVFGGDVEGVGDELGVGVGVGEPGGEGVEGVGVNGFVAGFLIPPPPKKAWVSVIV
jgi:hypothetical protein